MGSGFSRHPRTPPRPPPLPERTTGCRMPSLTGTSDESVQSVPDPQQPKLNQCECEVENTEIHQENELKMNVGSGDLDIGDKHPPRSHLAPKRARGRFDEDEDESKSDGGDEIFYPRIETPTFKRKDVRAYSRQNADSIFDLEHPSRRSFWPQDQLQRDLTLGDMEQSMDWAELRGFRKCTTVTIEDVRRDMEVRQKREPAWACAVEGPRVSSHFAILQVCGLLLYIVAICLVVMYALTR